VGGMARRRLRLATLMAAVKWLLRQGSGPVARVQGAQGSRGRGWLRPLAAMAAVILIVATATYLAVDVSTVVKPTAVRSLSVGTSSGQSLFMKRIAGDRKALFSDQLSEKVPRSVLVGDRYTLSVEVQSTIMREVGNSVVLVGGSVGVTARCFAINCTPITPSRQDITPADALFHGSGAFKPSRQVTRRSMSL
jgi:hypothetical protein